MTNMTQKISVIALAITLCTAPLLASEPNWSLENLTPFSESPVWEPQDLFSETELDAENERLQLALENTMLKLLVRLMELNMRNLDEELAQCTPNAHSTR